MTPPLFLSAFCVILLFEKVIKPPPLNSMNPRNKGIKNNKRPPLERSEDPYLAYKECDVDAVFQSVLILIF
jgi:hypothetical protein